MKDNAFYLLLLDKNLTMFIRMIFPYYVILKLKENCGEFVFSVKLILFLVSSFRLPIVYFFFQSGIPYRVDRLISIYFDISSPQPIEFQVHTGLFLFSCMSY